MKAIKSGKTIPGGGLDLSDEGNAEYILEKLGGKTYLQEKYPAVYRAFLKTKKKHSDFWQENSQQENKESFGLHSSVGVNTIEIRKEKMKQALEPDNENSAMLVGTSWLDLSEPMPYVNVQGQLINTTKGIILDQYDEDYEPLSSYQANKELKIKVSDIASYDNQEILSNVDFVGATYDSTLINYSDSIDGCVVDSGGYSTVSSITLNDPRSYKNNNPIIVLYDRNPNSGETADYSFSNIQRKSNNNVDTCLPIKGTIIFSQAYNVIGFDIEKTRERGLKTRLIYPDDNGGVCEYNRSYEDLAAYFKVDETNKNTIHFDFDKMWNHELEASKYTMQNQLKVLLSSNFYILLERVKDKIPKHVPISIRYWLHDTPSSYYYTEGQEFVGLPPISIRWGCIAKGSQITLENNKVKKVEELVLGDVIMMQDGTSMPVKDITTGKQQEMIYIETLESGLSLSLTYNHPVLTKDGAVMAGMLKPGNSIKVKDGKEETVKYAYTMNYNNDVYDLYFDGTPRYFSANGIIIGDLAAQGEMPVQQEKPKEVPELSEKTKELIKQLKALNRERAKWYSEKYTAL